MLIVAHVGRETDGVLAVERRPIDVAVAIAQPVEHDGGRGARDPRRFARGTTHEQGQAEDPGDPGPPTLENPGPWARGRSTPATEAPENAGPSARGRSTRATEASENPGPWARGRSTPATEAPENPGPSARG